MAFQYQHLFEMIGNNLGRLHRGDFENLSQVRLLVLNDNNITDIEEDALGRLEKLEQLFLNENLLSSVPASLPSTSLTALYLENNRITAIRAEDFVGFLQLIQLHLARNAIQSIETTAFDQLTRLDQSVSFIIMPVDKAELRSSNPYSLIFFLNMA